MGEQQLRSWPTVAGSVDLSTRRLVELNRGSGSIHSQVETELRRAARDRYGDSAARQAARSSRTTARLVAAPGRSDLGTSGESETSGKIFRYGGITAGAGIVVAIAGAVDVLSFALQPIFLATAMLAGFSTYLTGALLDRRRSTSTMAVEAVEDEAHGLLAVHVAYLDEPLVAPGQLAMWRFVSPGMRSYPVEGYLTCLPEDGMFRLMFALDEETADALRLVPIGTKVELQDVIEGSPEEIMGPAVIIVAGAGIALGRGLLDSLPDEITMIYRGDTHDDFMLVDELRGLADYRGADLRFSIGRDAAFPRGRRPLCAQHLDSVVADIGRCEVFVAGPEPMVRNVLRSLHELGVHGNQVHAQIF